MHGGISFIYLFIQNTWRDEYMYGTCVARCCVCVKAGLAAHDEWQWSVLELIEDGLPCCTCQLQNTNPSHPSLFTELHDIKGLILIKYMIRRLSDWTCRAAETRDGVATGMVEEERNERKGECESR